MTMIERRRLSKPTKEELLANFKGRRNTGRKKGVPNKLTRTLKEAIVLAAEAEGSDGKGRDGLVGYLRSVARDRPAVYTQLLGKLLPLEVQAKLMQMQLQLQANVGSGPTMPMAGVLNIEEIRALPTDDLHRVAAYVRRMMIPSPALKRLDAEVTDVETIDHQATPIEENQEPANRVVE